jgi:DNA-binding NtrC family response regulator
VKAKTEAIELVERDNGTPFAGFAIARAREYFDKLYFNYQMDKENGNVSRVADNMGIERTHLYRKLKQLGIKMQKKCSDNAQ